MRLWVDLLTPKQILFFGPLITEMQVKGHDVFATSRSYREVEQLAKMRRLEVEFVGARGGKEPLDQLGASLERMRALLPRVAEFRPDAALSVASADCARIAFGLRTRHIAVNDSPHSIIAGKLALPLSNHLLCPWVVPYSAWYKFGLRRQEITRYKALDPAVWLKREKVGAATGGKPPSKPTILVRLEEAYAPYMLGTDESWPSKVLERLASRFGDCRLIALCRYDDQLQKVKRRFGRSFEVPDKVVDGAEEIRRSDVFMGMGGTMTTEAALLGVPTISAYQGSGLYTERYLLSKKLLLKTRSLETLTRYVEKALTPEYREHCAVTSRKLLDSMEDPVQRVVEYLTGQHTS
ncbi:MAG: DUF354 domain-containing protein [Thaumarchaeota archaeon]|nr:DUF354 domain-containing protein [Nitrososphaerota archaeon]